LRFTEPFSLVFYCLLPFDNPKILEHGDRLIKIADHEIKRNFCFIMFFANQKNENLELKCTFAFKP